MKRRRTALWCSVSLCGLSVLVLVVGLLSATQTDNVAVSGYYPGIIVSDSTQNFTSQHFNQLFVLSFYSCNKTPEQQQVTARLSLKVCHYFAVSRSYYFMLNQVCWFVLFSMAAEFWSVLGYCWSEPGGESQADGEYQLKTSPNLSENDFMLYFSHE